MTGYDGFTHPWCAVQPRHPWRVVRGRKTSVVLRIPRSPAAIRRGLIEARPPPVLLGGPSPRPSAAVFSPVSNEYSHRPICWESVFSFCSTPRWRLSFIRRRRKLRPTFSMTRPRAIRLDRFFGQCFDHRHPGRVDGAHYSLGGFTTDPNPHNCWFRGFGISTDSAGTVRLSGDSARG